MQIDCARLIKNFEKMEMDYGLDTDSRPWANLPADIGDACDGGPFLLVPALA